MECDGSKNCHLTPCVKSLHICSRICLCKSQSLCFFEGVIKIPAFLGHFGQNIVGRTVDNSHYLSNLIACQTLFQGADNGNSAAYCCFKTKIAVISLSSLHQFLSVLCQQILVGSHYIFACFQRLQNIGSCRLHSAHQLDHNADLRIMNDAFPVIGQYFSRNPLSFLLQILYQNFCNLQFSTYFIRHLSSSSFYQLVDAAAYGSGTQKCRLDFLIFAHSSPPNSTFSTMAAASMMQSAQE